LITVIIEWLALTAVNRKRDAEYGDPALYTEEQKRAEMDKGDNASYFRYVT
jgi:hypothetical protein